MAHELSPSEAARRIGATTRSVQRWIGNGSLPARRVGGRWRVAIGALDALTSQESDGGGGATGDRQDGQRPIRSLFIANRGEIAARISRTCARVGIDAIVPV